MLTKNAISDIIKECNGDKASQRPNATNVFRFRMEKSRFWSKYEPVGTKPIGDGTYSVCIKCRNRFTAELVAVKVCKASHNVSKEVELLRACQGHPNVVRFIECLQDEAYTYIVMELLEGGELFERIRACSRFTEQEARQYFRQIVSALSFMHKKGIAHRDLKPENMLFVSRNSHDLKLVDFGFATECVPTAGGMQTPCFTLGYAAPEMLYGSGFYTESCDLWALGVILFLMLCGQTPFLPKLENRERHEKYISDMASRIQRGSFDTDTEYWTLVSPPAKHLVTGLLTVDPKLRLDMTQLTEHMWFKPSGVQLATPLLHTPHDQSAFVTEVKDTFDAFTHAQKLGFRLQDVGNAKLAQRRRHKQSNSAGSHCSEESDVGLSKSSSGIVTSDPNCRSISSSHATSVSSGLVISISDEGSRLSTGIEKPEKAAPVGDDDFYGFSAAEIAAFKRRDAIFVKKYKSKQTQEKVPTKRGRKRKMTPTVVLPPPTPLDGPMTRTRARRQGVDDRVVLLFETPSRQQAKKRKR